MRLFKIIALLLFSFWLVACAHHRNNDTVFPYQYQPELAKNSNIQRIMIVPVNYGVPSRHYLQAHEPFIDQQAAKYLQEAGYKTIPDKSFSSLWKKKILEYGEPYNPSTGKMSNIYPEMLHASLTKLFEQNPALDAVLFTDLIEEPLRFEKEGSKHASWSGVSRNIRTERIAYGEEAGITQNLTLQGVSIELHLLNRNGALVHHSRGGIQIIQSLELNNTKGKVRRRKDLLQDEEEIEEGIRLALHPFIVMDDYPARAK